MAHDLEKISIICHNCKEINVCDTWRDTCPDCKSEEVIIVKLNYFEVDPEKRNLNKKIKIKKNK